MHHDQLVRFLEMKLGLHSLNLMSNSKTGQNYIFIQVVPVHMASHWSKYGKKLKEYWSYEFRIASLIFGELQTKTSLISKTLSAIKSQWNKILEFFSVLVAILNNFSTNVNGLKSLLSGSNDCLFSAPCYSFYHHVCGRFLHATKTYNLVYYPSEYNHNH